MIVVDLRQGIVDEHSNLREIVVTGFWIIAALAASPIAIELFFRSFIARRIRIVIDSVPPLAITEEPSRSQQIPIVLDRSDGRQSSAALFRSTAAPRGLILFIPELDGTRWTAPLYCQGLIEAGFAILSVELKASSPTAALPIHWTTEQDMLSVEAALEFVRTRKDLRDLPLGAFGVSRGGTAVIVAACRHSEIRSVITDSGYSSMGMTRSFIQRFGRQLLPEFVFDRLPQWHIRKALWAAFRLSERNRSCRYCHIEQEHAKFCQPILMIRGARDSYVTADATTKLATCLSTSAEIWTVAKAKHNRARLAEPDLYRKRTVAHAIATLCSNEADDQDRHGAFVA